MKINTNRADIINVDFSKSFSYLGSALTIIPSQVKSHFTIKSCTFEELVSLNKGSALLVEQATYETEIKFEDCSFKYNISPFGGSIHMQFFADDSSDRDRNILLFPKLTLLNINTFNIFSIDGYGSFVYGEHLNVVLDNFHIISNSP